MSKHRVTPSQRALSLVQDLRNRVDQVEQRSFLAMKLRDFENLCEAVNAYSLRLAEVEKRLQEIDSLAKTANRLLYEAQRLDDDTKRISAALDALRVYERRERSARAKAAAAKRSRRAKRTA